MQAGHQPDAGDRAEAARAAPAQAVALPPLPDIYGRENVQLIHIQPIGYDYEGDPIKLDDAGAHAWQVWVEVHAQPGDGSTWTHVPPMERHYTIRENAYDYAWALAAKYNVQVEVHDTDWKGSKP